ncbi:NUDIX domain-containing protein [Candidatus Bipolaricaulota bacterium]|nr:NUDIX domain-containing protein [Candidatus Bipolaricaulota bacterium]
MRLTSPSETEEGEERAAGFVLFRTFHSQRLYLILRHHGDCHWGFPKGHLKSGEGELDAAIRETQEETSIHELSAISGFRETCRYTVDRNGKRTPKTAVYFLAETRQSMIVLSSEHQDFQWLPFVKAIELLTHDACRRVLANAETLLASSFM